MISRADEFRQKALEADLTAETLHDPMMREHYRKLAHSWRTAAAQAASLENGLKAPVVKK